MKGKPCWDLHTQYNQETGKYLFLALKHTETDWYIKQEHDSHPSKESAIPIAK